MQLQMGVIGVGGLGYLQTNTYSDIEGVSIVAGADVSPDARSLFETEFGEPAYEDYRRMLDEHGNELDAVTIVTPHTLHYEQAMHCLERGVHVLVEKPMVTDVGHAVDLQRMARASGLVLQVGYQRHFHPAFREIRRILRSGRIGDIHAISCHLGQDWIELHRDTWRADPALSGGGQLYDTGSHLFDALLWTTGTTATTVSAQVEYAKPEVDVNSALAVELDRGGDSVIASIGISGDGVDVEPTEGYFFWGTDGRLSYANGVIRVTEKGAMTYSTEIPGDADFRTLNRRKLENFTQSIEGTVEPAVPAEVGVQVTALTEATYRAADTGTEVSVQSLVDEARRTVDTSNARN